MLMNLSHIIEGHADDSVALISRGRETTYATLRAQVASMRGELTRLGVTKGDVVALLCGNSRYFVVSYLAAVGIGAIVLNGAKIGKNCLVGAGALVTEGKEFPDGSMILGSPAKVVRDLTPEQIAGLRKIAQYYIDNAKRFRNGLKKLA